MLQSLRRNGVPGVVQTGSFRTALEWGNIVFTTGREAGGTSAFPIQDGPFTASAKFDAHGDLRNA